MTDAASNSDWSPSTDPVATEDFAACPILVLHYWAVWDLIDREMDKRLAVLREEYANRIGFRSCDVDREENRSFIHGIANIPALGCFIRGKWYQSLIGLRSVEELRQAFDGWLAAADMPAHQISRRSASDKLSFRRKMKRLAWRALVWVLLICTVAIVLVWGVAMGRAVLMNRPPEWGFGSGSTRYAVGMNATNVYVVRIIRDPNGPPPPNQTGVVSMGKELESGFVYPVQWSHDFREAYYSANVADTYDVDRPQILPHWQRVIEMDRKWVIIGIWPCVLVLGLLPAIVGLRVVWRAFQRRRNGNLTFTHCRRCGYDLRATPDRCPECGTSAIAARPSADAARGAGG